MDISGSRCYWMILPSLAKKLGRATCIKFRVASLSYNSIFSGLQTLVASPQFVDQNNGFRSVFYHLRRPLERKKPRKEKNKKIQEIDLALFEFYRHGKR